MSKEIIVKTQKDLDNIKKDFNGTIYIEGGTWDNPIIYKENFENAFVVTRGSAYINMWGTSRVGTMRETSQVGEMWGTSQVGMMRETSQVGEMWGTSQVGEMWGTSQVGMMRETS